MEIEKSGPKGDPRGQSILFGALEFSVPVRYQVGKGQHVLGRGVGVGRLAMKP